MTLPNRTPPPPPGEVKALAWVVAGALLLAVFAFPQWEGAVVVNDEAGASYRFAKFVGDQRISLDKFVEIVTQHTGHGFIRPIDLVAVLLVDVPTRDARWALLLHVPAVLLFLLGVAVAARRLVPDEPLVPPLAVMALGLGTATSLVVWQSDTSSQSWAAAAGLWLCLLTWRGAERVSAGRSITLLACGIVALGVVGVLTKEVFYGWVFVASLVAVGGFARARGSGPVSFAEWMKLALSVTSVPVAFLLFRFAQGGELSEAVLGEPESRYSTQLGGNVIRNVGLSVLGFLPNGPSHAVFGLDGASTFPRALSPLAWCASAILVAMPVALLGLGSQRALPPDRRTVYVAAALIFLALAVVWPTARVSEVYLFGPNAGGALLLAVGSADGYRILRGGSLPAGWRRITGTALFVGVVVGVLGLNALGLVSRARHVALNWTFARTLLRSIEQYQATRPPGPIGTVYLPTSCSEGRSYSQIVLTPEMALRTVAATEWVARKDPTRPLTVRRLPRGVLPDPSGFLLPCSRLPGRPVW